VLLGFIVWLERVPLGGLVDALTARLRARGGGGAPP
jgi:hypothetical protein